MTNDGLHGAEPRKPAVVVTGGSRGIGFALAQHFVKKGRNVAIVSRDRAGLDQALTSLNVKSGVTIVGVACDVTHPDAHATISRHIQDAGLYLDVLANCAGVGAGGSFVSQGVDEIAGVTALNVDALTRLTRLALPDMIARRRGGVINFASLGAYVPGPNQAVYYATKSYVLSLTEALASETSGSGVSIAVVLPGPANTGFHAVMGAEKAFYRLLLPAMSAARVAASTVWCFEAGHRVIVPGLFNKIAFVALRILPHTITVPLMEWLLRQRRSD